ncbi:D-2-hydroxyacid dehydrogenase [Fusibacter bizertensis]|uniref:D-2-hydroxyacid dehydrogenase n=1 Tax=Fusibacter bizertensis TaxID=1488331 RepID=A0ABT6NCD4_9FIRM|nr:D-2-hydroxyacid dehydrogenase [Fusibacter bizertensis]MDH8678076.1 D-2-hydroxyacid dehydrogenase [Fusibacter bizertensis]
MKIVVLDGYTLNPGDISWDGLSKLGDLTVYERTKENEIIERIGKAEIVYTNKTPITKEVLVACPQIKFIGVLATGYNVVDTEAAKAFGIPVCNVPTYGTDAVSQYVFALLLNICHRVELHSESVFKGDWARCEDFCYWKSPLIELAGKSLGVVGLGRIGKRTAEIAEAFGMKVLAYDPHPIPDFESTNFKYVSLEDLYKNSDVISLHVPLFESTRGMINKDTISQMKKGVIIINTSRGPLINEFDLVEALNSGKIGAAALDVVETEPIHDNSVLLNAKNLFITPHIAWAPTESRARLLDIAINNLDEFLKGNIVNRVNN